MGNQAIARALRVALICGFLLLLGSPSAYADLGGALGSLIAGLFEIPRATLAGTFGGPPIIGTAFGLLSGAVNTVGYLARGTLELAGSAIPIAKTIGPLLLPFLL